MSIETSSTPPVPGVKHVGSGLGLSHAEVEAGNMHRASILFRAKRDIAVGLNMLAILLYDLANSAYLRREAKRLIAVGADAEHVEVGEGGGKIECHKVLIVTGDGVRNMNDLHRKVAGHRESEMSVVIINGLVTKNRLGGCGWRAWEDPTRAAAPESPQPQESAREGVPPQDVIKRVLDHADEVAGFSTEQEGAA